MNNASNPVSVVEQILQFNHDRKRAWLKIKYARMAENAFAFFRGTNHLYAARWPRMRPADHGPNLLICGDLHLDNFGAYRSDAGDFRYDINDFDEALLAPCGLDVTRCTTSILLAADAWGIAPVEAGAITVDFLASYRAVIATTETTGEVGEVVLGRGEGPVLELLGETAAGIHSNLLDRQTERTSSGERRIIRREEKHPDVSEKKQALVRAAIEKLGATTSKPEAYRVLDATGRIAGIGSLGVRRYLVLIAGGGTPDTNRLLDVKEATASSLLSCTEYPQSATLGNRARCIVQAQSQLQSKPAAGLAAIEIDGLPYRVREMVPDENRSKLSRLRDKPDGLRHAIALVGQLAAWSQIRGCAMGAPDAKHALADWTAGAGLDAVLPAAVRYADATCRDFESFRRAYAERYYQKQLDE